MSISSLSSDAPADLIRAVPLRHCLQSWGFHFSKESNSATKNQYELSQPTGSIDAFLSHDWETPRSSKIIALLLIFNSVPASTASLLVSVPLSAMTLFGYLPGGWITASGLTDVTFYVVFCFWQQIRWIVARRGALVFLDRLCIAQHDEHLKQEGILGLAGFLSVSKSLIVSWQTPAESGCISWLMASSGNHMRVYMVFANTSVLHHGLAGLGLRTFWERPGVDPQLSPYMATDPQSVARPPYYSRSSWALYIPAPAPSSGPVYPPMGSSNNSGSPSPCANPEPISYQNRTSLSAHFKAGLKKQSLVWMGLVALRIL